MTIVASNSITVSNVNDGTITHTAYSWSSDGTDRFTTVYPGENLFTIDMISPTNSTSNAVISGNSVTYPSGGWADEFMSNAQLKELLKPSATYSVQYVFELLSKAEGTSVYMQNKHGSLLLYSSVAGYPSIDLGNARVYGNANDAQTWTVGTVRKRESTFNTPATLHDSVAKYKILYYTSWSMNPDGTFNTCEKGKFYNVKFEEKPAPTVYTPAPSEDYANAYPTYTGTYTDYTEADSTNPADYTWVRILGEAGQDGVAGKDGIGIKSTAVTYSLADSGTTAPTGTWNASVPTLIKGQYLWTKTVWQYTDGTDETGYSVTYISKDGNNGTNGLPGKDGVGITSTAITYVGSASGTTKPTSGWTTTIPSVAEGSYLWTKTVWTYSDGTNETGYSVAKMGAKGDKGDGGAKGDTGLILSNTAPANPTVGQLWQNTSMPAPQTIYKWTGTEWDDEWGVGAQNVITDKLSALSADLGNVTAGSYESWETRFISPYTYMNGIFFKNGVLMTLAIENPSSTNHYVRGTINTSGQIRFYQGQLPKSTTDDTDKMFNKDGSNTFFYNPTFEVGYIDSYKYGTGQGQITYKADMHNFLGTIESQENFGQWYDLSYLSGFKADPNNPAKYRYEIGLDGIKIVKFKGFIQRTSGNFDTSQAVVAILPAGYRPPGQASMQGTVNGNGSCRLTVINSGHLHLWPSIATSYIGLDGYYYAVE